MNFHSPPTRDYSLDNIRFVLANNLETVFENALCEKKAETKVTKEKNARKIISDTTITSRRRSNA